MNNLFIRCHRLKANLQRFSNQETVVKDLGNVVNSYVLAKHMDRNILTLCAQETAAVRWRYARDVETYTESAVKRW